MNKTTRVYAVGIVKDEKDIIVQQIKWLHNQGMDGIIVADNMSTDGTYELLKSLHYPNLKVVIDKVTRHHQNESIVELANYACDLANSTDLWIVPFEADNFICTPGKRNIRDSLLGLDDSIGAIKCNVYTYFLTELSDEKEPNIFKRIQYRENWQVDEYIYRTGKSRRTTQVCYRYKIGRRVPLGFHYAYDNQNEQDKVPTDRRFYMTTKHFPVRSKEHFIVKYTKWLKTMEDPNSKWAKHTSGIHRYYGRMIRDDIKKAMALFEQDWVKDSKDLVYDPLIEKVT